VTAAAGGLSAIAHHRRLFVALNSYRRPSQEGISWETRPRSVMGMISSAAALKAFALSTRCGGAAGQHPGGTWPWLRRASTSGPSNRSSGHR
jgi:hypothetical protein